MPLDPGFVIDGNTIVSHKGKGNFGNVYCVSSPSHTTNIALKMCEALTAEDITRFKRENEVLHILKTHPQIIEPYSDIVPHGSTFYYLMELADTNLTKLLSENNNLSIDDKLEMFKKICEGLKHVHSIPVIHRDLWWDNILIKINNNINEPKLGDFGRARVFSKNSENYQPQKIWGVNIIIPPEFYFQIWDNPTAPDYVVGDIFALGLLLYYILEANPDIFTVAILATFPAFKGYIAMNNISYSSNADRYFAWVNWVSPRRLETQLTTYQTLTDRDDRINNFLYKLCSLDYRTRYQTVDDVLIDLNQI